LLANLRFDSRPAESLLTTPVQQGTTLNFPIPVDDFAFAIHTLTDDPLTVSQQSAAILFCIEGDALLKCDEQMLSLTAGESAWITASESPLTLSGTGRVARVYNDLPNCG